MLKTNIPMRNLSLTIKGTKPYHLALFVLILMASCQSDQEVPSLVVGHATATDFEEAKQVSPILANGLQLDLWAPGTLLSNAVALTFDNNGIAYVAETSRRKSSDLDIRAHQEWMLEDIGLQTIEDTRAFHLKKLATPLSEKNTWQKDFNKDGLHDYRDLEVQSEYIRRVWDSNGDGRADTSHLYAAGFNDMLTGVAAGILSVDDAIYLTAAPDVYRLKDTDKDGIANERKVISHGYGIHIAFAGHDMSGLTMGPDGRIYWSIGDIGVNVVDANGKRWAYPNQGAVMRCNPDGSDFEVFAHGLRNPQELAFDDFGNLLSVDNDGDHAGEHERYVHIVEGSDTGWRINWQFGKYRQPNEAYRVWVDEKLHLPHFPGQAAYLLPPLGLAYDGPAGFAYNPGTGLSEGWKEYFFVSYFTASSANSKIQAFKLKSKGASFEPTNIKEVVGGIVPTGISFAADGALYINDWKDSYAKKPAGRIWKLTAPKATIKALQKETQTLLEEGMEKKSAAELAILIAHADQRVRMAAQFELVKRKATSPLLSVAKSAPNLLGRIHAIWGIGQLARQDSNYAIPLTSFLNDVNENIRAQTAKVIGDAKFAPALDSLIFLLKDASAKVQFFAAEALGKIGDEKAFQPLVELLAQVEEKDPHLRHAIVYGLSRLNKPILLAELANHPSKFVRIGAVVALRIIASPKVADFLGDTEPLVLTEAARAINDDFSIPDALPALAKALERVDIQNEAFIRRAINANLRVATAEAALRLANYALSDKAPEEMRQDALWALGYWSDPPLLDRVDNRYRKLEGHRISDAHKAIAIVFPQLINGKNANLKVAMITAANRTNYKAANTEVLSIFENEKEPLTYRIAALNTLVNLKSKDLIPAINRALVDEQLTLRKAAQSLLDKVDLPKETLVILYKKILEQNTIEEKQDALASLAKINDRKAVEILQKYWQQLTTKALDPALHLDVLLAIEQSAFEELKALKKAYENKIPADDLLAIYEPTLYGGNKDQGSHILSNNNAAQCLRCHAFNGKGSRVGPDLDHIADKLDRENLLLSLIDPNARIAEGYGTVILKLKNGEEKAGILMGETKHDLQLKIGNAPIQTFLKKNIQERETLPSGMLNMSKVLNKSQIRDLVAYLVTLKSQG